MATFKRSPMRYAQFETKGLTSTGVVEAGARRIGARLKRSGSTGAWSQFHHGPSLCSTQWTL